MRAKDRAALEREIAAIDVDAIAARYHAVSWHLLEKGYPTVVVGAIELLALVAQATYAE